MPVKTTVTLVKVAVTKVAKCDIVLWLVSDKRLHGLATGHMRGKSEHLLCRSEVEIFSLGAAEG